MWFYEVHKYNWCYQWVSMGYQSLYTRAWEERRTEVSLDWKCLWGNGLVSERWEGQLHHGQVQIVEGRLRQTFEESVPGLRLSETHDHGMYIIKKICG